MRTTIGGVSHLFLSRHGAARRALGSDFRARCEMGLEIKQRPMDDLGLCALGPILIYLFRHYIFILEIVFNMDIMDIIYS